MSSREPNTAEPMIGALLRIPWQAIRARVHRELVARGFVDIRPRDLAILQYPGPDGGRPTELAARVGLSKQAVQPLIVHLEHCGYLDRAPDPTDRRAVVLSLTQRGEQLVAAIREIATTIEGELAGEMGPTRYADFRARLKILGKLLIER